MSIFRSMMSKIFNAAESAVGTAGHPGSPTAPATNATAAQPVNTTVAAPDPVPVPGQSASAAQPVDVEAVLSALASSKGGGGNWRTSIVDLLKLLDLDSSLNARTDLATELNIHAGANGSAEENIALHKAVMQKLEENGGKVPASLRG
jgi:hypothetical protein